MNAPRIESTVLRIVTGKLIFSVNNDTITYTPPCINKLYEAELFYESYISQLGSEFLWAAQVENELKKNNMFDPNLDKEKADADEYLKQTKIDLYLHHRDKNALGERLCRVRLKKIKQNLEKIYTRQHTLEGITKETAAAGAKFRWIVSQCTTVNNTPISHFDFLYLYKIATEIQKRHLTTDQMRKIARNDTWLSHYHSGFLQRTTPNEEQLAIVSTTKMYESIYKNPAAPDESVIEDPDLLDGWILWNRQETMNSSIKDEIDSKVPKNAQAVFIPMKGSTRKEQEAEAIKLNKLNKRSVNLNELR